MAPPHQGRGHPLPSIYTHQNAWIDLTWLATARVQSGDARVDVYGSNSGTSLLQVLGLSLAEAEALASELTAAVKRAREAERASADAQAAGELP